MALVGRVMALAVENGKLSGRIAESHLCGCLPVAKLILNGSETKPTDCLL